LELFTILNLPIPQVEDNGVVKYTAGEDALRTYLTEYPRSPMRKFIELLLKYREYEKLISTYGHSFLSKLDANGYIHTSYTPCFTHTGRLSSRSPNLQNIPATDLVKDGYDIRQYFLADPGHVMITCDMEGAEVRIAADYSQEPKLIASILNDEDLHSKLASKSYSIIFGQKVKIDKSNDMLEVDGMKFKKRELRDTHKSVLFAKFYKGGAKRIYGVLAEYINLFHDEGQMDVAGKISKAMDKELPILSKYLTSLIDEAKETGMLRGSKLGRIRYFDANVFGEAANYPIQNTNSEALKIALIKLDEYLEDKNARLVMNVHDEVVVSVHPSIAEEVAERVKKIMGEALGWFMQSIPGGASYSIEKHWKK
jgi:DNA polymerase-1